MADNLASFTETSSQPTTQKFDTWENLNAPPRERAADYFRVTAQALSQAANSHDAKYYTGGLKEELEADARECVWAQDYISGASQDISPTGLYRTLHLINERLARETQIQLDHTSDDTNDTTRQQAATKRDLLYVIKQQLIQDPKFNQVAYFFYSAAIEATKFSPIQVTRLQ